MAVAASAGADGHPQPRAHRRAGQPGSRAQQSPQDELSAKTVALAEQYGLASWLWSPLPIDALARHLAAFVRAELGTTAVLLRPYDPRIMEDTIACLEPARQAALWKPVVTWAYFDMDEALKSLPRPAVQSALPVTVPLVLDDNEQRRFEELANRIALGAHIDAHAPAVMESLSLAESKAFCAQQITIGERLQTDSMSDLLIIATLSRVHGPQWIDDETLAPLLQSIASGGVPLARMAPEIDEQLTQRLES